MVIVHELIRSIIMLVDILFTVLYWLLVVRIILSWVGVNPYTTSNDLLSALFQVTDVLLLPFQKLPLRLGMIDFSPIVAFVALQFMHRIVLIGLTQLAGVIP